MATEEMVKKRKAGDHLGPISAKLWDYIFLLCNCMAKMKSSQKKKFL